MRKRFSDYHGDVVYDVWRNDGNVDAIDDDEVKGYFDDYLYPEQTADEIVREQRRRKR